MHLEDHQLTSPGNWAIQVPLCTVYHDTGHFHMNTSVLVLPAWKRVKVHRSLYFCATLTPLVRLKRWNFKIGSDDTNKLEFA